METFKIAEIIVDNKCKETDKIYSYAVPKEINVKIGHRVIVPFGRGNKKIAGYVIGFTDEINFNREKLKSILKLAEKEPLISSDMVKLVKWIKEKYLCYYIEAIHALIPANVRIKTTYYYECIENDYEEKLHKLGNYEILIEIIEFIKNNGKKISKEELRDCFNDRILDNSLKKLISLKIIKQTQGVKKKESKKYENQLFINNKKIGIVKIPANAIRQKQAMGIIKANPGISSVEIRNAYNINSSVINTLLEKELITLKQKEIYRFSHEETEIEPVHKLTKEQLHSINLINNSFNKGHYVLLHGVTGSGKTEIYLELVEEEIKKGRQGIVLVPEISLTPQMIRRFVSRFGNTVAVLHSGLSDGEKYDEWRRISEGKAKVAVGARSAIFAPFKNLGLIIIDEEHEHTYKSELKPKYNAREIAEKRCKIEGCKLILGSATPSIEIYYKAIKSLNNYNLVSLTKRVNEKPMPKIDIVDMRTELQKGNKSIFSEKLFKSIKETLEKDDQIILFLNRRGYSTFVSCRNCGYVEKCLNCNISLTYHSKGNYLSCHYCGYSKANPKICPNCKSKHIRYFGIGTQKVENEFKNVFAVKDVLRMDADTTRRKNSHRLILDNFRRHNANVLIGTQMIGKGHDFPNVTLVGIITADTFLNIPDFRSAEKTFQSIIQAAGRAGRGKKLGHVIVQTYTPEHYALIHCKDHDYVNFYKEEIGIRETLKYPPFSCLANMIFSGYNAPSVAKLAEEVGRQLIEISRGNKDIMILGPAPAPLSRIRNKYRWQIVIKSSDEAFLHKTMQELNNTFINDDNNISVSMDINPLNML